ncbi:alpha-amylase family glycosyl hydrolase [Prevotella sp.]|uniref:alpha-amylase family glycosyl hydrolase n=1 Tax=Prevotella sp. TaxID=59823 RepID=UPI002F954604
MKKMTSLLSLLLALPMMACGGSGSGSETPSGEGTSASGSVKIEALNVDNTKPLSAQNQVIYEMNVGCMTPEGTFKAATAKLADLRKLGIDIVWLMPIYPRGGGIDSPYAATDFKAVNPSYGSVADVKAFVIEAHRLGMKVWLDWVPNHTATNHRWVKEHADYYTKDSNGQMVHPNNYGDVFQLDYSNPALVKAMNDCLFYWIDQADIDGYRCDYISSPKIPANYWQDIIPRLKAHKKGLVVMGEGDLTDRNNQRLQGVGFDFDYAWKYQEGILYRSFGPQATDAAALQTQLEDFISTSSKMSNDRMTYLTNHDQNYNDGGRSLNKMYGENVNALTTLVFTLYGMPLIYNGQETGNDQILDYFHDTKIKWTIGNRKMYNTLRTLIALKHTQKALSHGTAAQRGSLKWLTTGNKSVMAYEREKDGNKVVVVLNFGTAQQTVTLKELTGGSYVQWLDSKTIASGPESRQLKLDSGTKITLGAKGYAVFVK